VSVRIRPAAAADAPAIARVRVAAWRAAYPGLVPAEILDALSAEERERGWREILARAPRSVLLAEEEDGTLLGFAHVGRARDDDAHPLRTGELYALYLLPEAWGAGVGRRLWEAARQWLIVEEFAEATCWVLEGNPRARRFYERAGFSLDDGVRREVRMGEASLPHLRYRITLV